MDLTPGQLSALEQMGIPVWESRSAQTAAVIEPITEDTDKTTASITDKAYILLVEDEALSLPQRRLLSAMLTTLGIKLQQLAVINSDFDAILTQLSSVNKLLVVCGDMLAAKVAAIDGQTPFVLKLPDIAQMLIQPSLKADAWQALKQAKLAMRPL